MGGIAYDEVGNPLPQDTIDGVLDSDACLFGAIGGPKWDNLHSDLRPESGLLRFRDTMQTFANLRPAITYDELLNSSTLKSEVIKGVDLLVVRELIGGIYFGKPRGNDGQKAYNTMVYTKDEVKRIAHKAFALAMSRNKKICSVDKANVLEVSKLWRDTVNEVSNDYPEVTLSHMYIDNACMQVVKDPRQFDVILTSNIFGDILSDTTAQVVGSIGLLPSASIGVNTSIYEPIHGSAPDIIGKGIANPIATILSASMMLKYSLKEKKASILIENSIKNVLKDGYRTKDIASFKEDGIKVLTTCEMGDMIVKYIENS